MGNQIESSVTEEHPIIENRVSEYWEIWVLYVDGSREKLAECYRYGLMYATLEMLREDAHETVREYYHTKLVR